MGNDWSTYGQMVLGSRLGAGWIVTRDSKVDFSLNPLLLLSALLTLSTPRKTSASNTENIMEALAAVGLAGNIVQFIDFTTKLLSQATSIYHSHDGRSDDARDLESIAQNFRDLSVELSQYRKVPLQRQNLAFQTNHMTLCKLAQDCLSAVNTLLSALESLKAKDPNSRWSSFRAALASTWKQTRIDALQKKLDSYRSQLVVQLQVMQE
jgi:hypothetical protein